MRCWAPPRMQHQSQNSEHRHENLRELLAAAASKSAADRPRLHGDQLHRLRHENSPRTRASPLILSCKVDLRRHLLRHSGSLWPVHQSKTSSATALRPSSHGQWSSSQGQVRLPTIDLKTGENRGVVASRPERSPVRGGRRERLSNGIGASPKPVDLLYPASLSPERNRSKIVAQEPSRKLESRQGKVNDTIGMVGA